MGMKPIEVRSLTPQELTALDELYRRTKDVRVRTRAQMILLGAEEMETAPNIAKIVRQDEQTVRRWIKRFNAEGITGLYDEPKSGAPRRVTDAYRERLLVVVRRRPRSLEQPFSLWTLQRLVDFMAEETGLRFSTETVRLILKANDIVISRPQHKVSSPDPEYEVKKRRSKRSGTT
jgi:transposase